MTLILKICLPCAKWIFGHLDVKNIRVWSRVLYFFSYPFLIGKRYVAEANLRIAFPELTDAERKRLLKRNFLYLMELGLDWCRFLAKPSDVFKLTKLSPEAQEIYDSHRNEKKAAFYCTLHFGNWELESRNDITTGRPITIVTAEFALKCVENLVCEFRVGTSSDVSVIHSQGAAIGVMRAIRSGRDVGILIDQCVSPSHGGEFVPFFGLPASTSKLPASIARHTGARVFIFGCRRCDDGTYCVEAEELKRPSKEYADDLELTADIMAAFERMIRKAPEQYLWFYPRWRYYPADCDETQIARFPSYARKARLLDRTLLKNASSQK